MDMETIADQLSADILILHSSGDHTGIAVVNTGHGVKEVGEVSGTGIESHLCIVIGSIGMCHGNSAKLAGFFNELLRAGQLGCQVHNADKTAARLLQLSKTLKIGRFQEICILCATLIVGEVGTLHLNTAENRQTLDVLVHQTAGIAESLAEVFVGQCHRGRSERGDTDAGVVGRHGLQALVITVREIGSTVAVAVDINETGDHGSALQIDGVGGDRFGQHCTEETILHLKSAGAESEIITENTSIFIEHGNVLPNGRFTSEREGLQQPQTAPRGASSHRAG